MLLLIEESTKYLKGIQTDIEDTEKKIAEYSGPVELEKAASEQHLTEHMIKFTTSLKQPQWEIEKVKTRWKWL